MKLQTLRRGTAPELLVRYLPPRPRAGVAVVVVHGLGGHGGRVHGLMNALEAQHLAPLALDLRGHGGSGGDRGVGGAKDWAADVLEAATWWHQQTGLPVMALGTGMGAVVALHALAHESAVLAAYAHAPLLPRWRPKLRRAAAAVGRFSRLAVPTAAMAPPRLAFVDAVLRANWQADPSVLRWYPSASLLDLVSAAPVTPWAANVLPVVLAAGERDRLCSPARVLDAWLGLGGPKRLEVIPQVAHALAEEEPATLARHVAAWAASALPSAGPENVSAMHASLC